MAKHVKKKVDVQVIVTDSDDNDVDKLEYQRPAYVAVGLIMAMTAISILFPLIIMSSAFGLENVYNQPTKPCHDPCRITLVESIPENLTYPAGSPAHPSTFSTWQNLIQIANKSIEIASFYWTLRGDDIYSDPSDWQGEAIYEALLKAGTTRGIKIRIAQNAPSEQNPNYDTIDLSEKGAVQVRSVNFTRLMGAGVLHTKLWIIDSKHFYVGSANMDWRSLTQVKELGVAVYNCSCLAKDVAKIFEVYWYLGRDNVTIPQKWPLSLKTIYNNYRPMNVQFADTKAQVYVSSSPSPFCPSGRTVDIDAILDIIEKAQEFIYVAVMDYIPLIIYQHPVKFWPNIDNALRRAAIDRRVKVRVLASEWKHTSPDMLNFLRSLAAINGADGTKVEVKLFTVPAFTPAQQQIPYSRVNHNKYMVTDSVAYIGTSNWSGDYFTSTGGAGLVVNETASGRRTTVQSQLRDVFLRDWTSPYTRPLPGFT